MDETHPEEDLLTGPPRWLRGHSYGAMPPARSKTVNRNPSGLWARRVRGYYPPLQFKNLVEPVLQTP